VVQRGGFYVCDRGSVDYDLFAQWHALPCSFIVRVQNTAAYEVAHERALSAAAQAAGVTSDVVLQRLGTAPHRPCAAQPLRVVCVTTDQRHKDGTPIELVLVTNRLDLAAELIALAYRYRWTVGVSSQGSLTQSVQVRPRPRDSGLVAREAPGRESQPVKPSDNTLCKERAQRSRLQRTVNAEVASLHATPVAEPVDNVRRQQGPSERSLPRRSSPAGYQRRHGAKGERATGEVRGVRRRKLAAEAWPITVSGKWLGWPPDGGSGRSTEHLRAAKRAGREGPEPVGNPFGKGRQE